MNFKLYNDDSYEIINKIKADCLITDPPYEMVSKGGGIGAKRQYLKDIGTSEIERGFDISIFDNFDRIVTFCSKSQIRNIIEYFENRKFAWNLLTWNKSNPPPLTNNNYLPDIEYVLHGFSSGGIYGRYKEKSKFILTKNGSNKSIDHPTTKPIEVMKKFILSSTQKGDIILDPFMGSGSTGVAALQTGRKFIGIEKEKKYFDISKRRIEEADKQRKQFDKMSQYL